MRGSWVFILWLASAVIARAIATAALTVLTSFAVILFSSVLSAVTGAGRGDRAPEERLAEQPDGSNALHGHRAA